MAQVNFDWVTGAASQARDPFQTVDPDGGGSFGLTIPLISEQDMEDKEQNLRVERIVGFSYLALEYETGTHDPTDPWVSHERIYVSELDEFGNPDTAHNLASSFDVDRDWLWERVQVHSSTSVGGLHGVWDHWATQMNSFHDPFWTRLDVRNKRRLRDRQILIYDVQAEIEAPSNPGSVLWVFPRIRVGVKF